MDVEKGGAPHHRLAAVVFDLDGTLLDTMTAAPAAYADTIRALGGHGVSPADVVAAWHIGPMPVVLAHFLDRPTTAEDIESFYRRFGAAVATVRPFPGVVEMISSLGDAGYLLGVFTSATRRAAELTLSTAGLGEVFPVVVCGDEVSEPKPAPDGLRLACRKLGVSPTETAYVGDAAVDQQCAAAAGAAAICAGWGATPRRAADGPVALRPSDVLAMLGAAAVSRAGRDAGW